MTDDRIYFRQFLAGEDFGRTHPDAGAWRNFVYAIGDRITRECLLVDAAWDVRGLLANLEADGMTPAGVLATHYHPDHVGGEFAGMEIEGLAEILALAPVPIHANKEEAEGIRIMTGLERSDLVLHEAGDVVMVGEVPVTLIHTPGHTPGSQCFLVADRLVSGDTLFVNGCGRVDLPGSDPDAMYISLTQRLAKLPEETVLYPGHDYGPTRTATIGEQRRTNQYMRIRSIEDWRALMG